MKNTTKHNNSIKRYSPTPLIISRFLSAFEMTPLLSTTKHNNLRQVKIPVSWKRGGFFFGGAFERKMPFSFVTFLLGMQKKSKEGEESSGSSCGREIASCLAMTKKGDFSNIWQQPATILHHENTTKHNNSNIPQNIPRSHTMAYAHPFQKGSFRTQQNTTTERSELIKTIEKTNMNLNKTQPFSSNNWQQFPGTSF